MLKIWKVVVFIGALMLATISLAAACDPDDSSCELDKKKAQMMDKMGIKPIETKDQVIPGADKKQLPKPPQPFQIPPPGDSQDGTSDQSVQVQYNPGLKIPTPVSQNNVQEQQAVPQPQQSGIKPLMVQSVLQPLPQPQTQTVIYH